MQITLVCSSDSVSDVLNHFEATFSSIFNWVVTKKESDRSMVSVSEVLAKTCYICDLKKMTDFLVTKFNVGHLNAPKRNSKVSLADWIAKILLSAREAASEVETPTEATKQTTDVECPNCGIVHEPFQNSLCTYGDPSLEIEVLEPEEKPVYTISIIADGQFSEERVSALPPYLIDRKGNLLKKLWHRKNDASYVEINSQHLSNIAVGSGLIIELMMAEDLEVYRACIVGDPPLFLIHGGGAYKRDRLRLNLAVRYSQVLSEHLSNIVVVF